MSNNNYNRIELDLKNRAYKKIKEFGIPQMGCSKKVEAASVFDDIDEEIDEHAFDRDEELVKKPKIGKHIIKTESVEFKHYKKYTLYLKEGQYETLFKIWKESEFDNVSELIRSYMNRAITSEIELCETPLPKNESERHKFICYPDHMSEFLTKTKTSSPSSSIRSLIDLYVMSHQ
jgi:hypothetical protein